MSTPGLATIKACCAAAYGSDAVAVLLGETHRPGGLALTRRLARRLGLRPGDRVADIASGTGATARLLAGDYGVRVDAVDLRPSTVDCPGVHVHVGDAEQIPLPDSAFDAVVCECAFCTFPDKPAAAAELARLLRPGGQLGLTDVTVTHHGLPAELTGPQAWVACIADARPARAYEQLLRDAGLRITHTERHDQALVPMIDQIEARLALLAGARVDVDVVRRYTRLARHAVDDGLIGYVLLTAERPSRSAPPSRARDAS
jgi:arsenite methyltransferase